MSLACPAPYLTPSVDCFHNSSTKLGPNTTGVNIMHISGPEWTLYFGVSGTFLAHFVTFLSKI